MKKIIPFTIKSVREYCFAFSCCFKTGLSKSNFTFPLNQILKLWLTSWHQKLALPLVFLGILMTGYTTVSAQNIKGIVPVSTPVGGDGIDGDAWAHQPIGTAFIKVGDLFDDRYNAASPAYDPNNPTLLHNTNHGLIDPATGNVLYKPSPATVPPSPQSVPVTYQLKDPYLNDPTIFTLSNKINDNPNTYTWGPGSSPNKNEIQNCGAHFSYGDPNIKGGVTNLSGTFISPSPSGGVSGSATDLWCLFAGDRQVTTGSSYIDFEFLQAPLTMTGAVYGPVDPLTGVAPITGGSGKFVTAAPDATGGRTPGDILITIEFTQGGGDATVVIQQWQLVGSIYQYVVISNDSFPGYIFCTNNSVTTTVPFDAYGVFPGVYAPNQWAEGAINLTQVLTYLHNPCTAISTLFIRTRSSGNSSQSELKDFPGAPIQLNLNFRPDAPTTTGATVCGPGPVQVNLSANGCTGGTLKWYDAATNGNKVNEGLTYSPTISTTTSYWVSCTSSSGCEGPRTQVTATVNTVNPGIVAGNQTLCSPFDPAAFTNTTAGSASDGGVITYQWQMSTTGCAGTWSDISGATSAAYDAGVVSVITNFRRVTTATLNGVACSANSNCLTVSPNAINPGVIAGDQIGCSPFDALAFTSTTAGSTTGVGVISYQWQMSTTGCDGTWANIPGATSATFDPPAVTVITNYRRVATSTLNTIPCSANSNCLTVTPTGIVPGEIAGSQTLCSPFDPAAFTSVTPGSDHGTISYQWQSSTDGTTFTNIAGANSVTYDAPAIAVKTWFRRVATSDVNCSGNSNVLTVTPNDIVPGTIAGDQTLCSPFDPAAFTSTTVGSTTNGGAITYQWQWSTTGCDGTWANIPGATSATYDAGVVSVITNFRRVATSTLNGVACSANSNCLTVTPNNINPGVVAGDQVGCSPFDAVAFTNTTSGSSTGAGVISYQWQMSTTGCDGTWANIPGATSATFDPPAVTVITNYRRVATSTLNGVACSANSNCLTVTPTGIVPGEIAGSQTLCAPFNPAAFTSVTPGSDHGTISYQWQSSTDGTTFTNIVGATSATYDAPAVAVKTWFRRVATSDVGCAGNSNVLTVTPNDIVPGTIAGDQTLCSPFDPAAFTSATMGSTTNGGVITYQWQWSTTGCDGTWANIPGATSATYDAGIVSVITNFRRVATSTLNGVACSANSNCLTVIPNPVSPGVIAGDQVGCSPFDAVAFTNTTSGSTTGAGVISYQWQMSTTGCDGTWANIQGATSATFDPPAVTVITNYRRVATSTLNSVACSANSNCLTVTPTGIVPGEIAGSQTLCAPFDPAAFTSVTPGSDHGTISYQWQSSTDGTTFTNIVGATSATYDAPAVTVKTWFRRVASSDVNCSGNSNVLTVTPNDIVPGTIAGDQTLCSPFDPAAFTSTTMGSTTNGGVITYQWQWSTTGCDGTWANIPGATSATYDAGVVSVITNFRRVATSTLNGVTCSANSNCLTVTPNNINPGVVAGEQTKCGSFDPDPFTSTTAGSTTGAGVITYQWQISITGCDGNWTDIPGATSATYDAPLLTDKTSYRRVATSTINGVACSANSNCLTVTPSAVPTALAVRNLDICFPIPIDLRTAILDALPDPLVELITFWRDPAATADQITDVSNFTAGPGTYTIYLKEVLLASGCPRVQQFSVNVKSCSAALCTYTQGYYGNPGGMSCAGGQPFTTAGLIARALASYGGTMTIGSSGHSVYIMNNSTDIDALITVMPGGGGSKVLAPFDFEINQLPPNYLKNGRINNTLLAQTIALGLNIGINGALGNFELKPGTFATAAPEGGCGSDIPKTRQCSPGGLTPVINEYKYYSISTAVINAISPKTVQGLFALANQALGGGSTNGLTLTQIADAVDAINNAFDECRIFVGYGIEPLVCIDASSTLINTTTTLTSNVTSDTAFTAYPVPFKDQLTISYDFKYVTFVKIEVFNTQGIVVASNYDTNGYLNKEVLLNIPYTGQSEVYVVQVTTNRGSSVQKVLSSQ